MPAILVIGFIGALGCVAVGGFGLAESDKRTALFSTILVIGLVLMGVSTVGALKHMDSTYDDQLRSNLAKQGFKTGGVNDAYVIHPVLGCRITVTDEREVAKRYVFVYRKGEGVFVTKEELAKIPCDKK